MMSRRRFLRRAAACAVAPVVGGVYATQVEPFWPRFHELPLTIKNLPPAFEGFRLAQLSDLHAGRVPLKYLARVVDRVTALKPDAVIVTGDLVDHSAAAVQPISRVLGTLPMPVIASTGNHDFGVRRDEDEAFEPALVDLLDAAVTAAGIALLRNGATSLARGNDRLWFVGLDDLWYGQFDPATAFTGVPSGAAVLALSHNPDTAPLLDAYAPAAVFAGHTHGGQVRIPWYGAPRLNVAHPEYDRGHFQLPRTQLYVSAGVGYIRRLRFDCRPEVPVFRLTGSS